MLLKLSQESTGESIALERSPLVVGRLTDADIRCDDHSLARRHALIVEYLSGWAVHDLCSIAGIRINGTRVPRGELHVGDTLQIGKIVYSVLPDDPSSLPEIAKLSSTDKVVAADENFFADVLEQDERSEPTHAVLDFYLDGKLHRAVPLPGDVVVGYADRANICLPRKGISSLHCLVAQDNGTWYMHDLKGGTGIALDGILKSTIRLEGGARIQAGDFEIVFRNATISEINAAERPTADSFGAERTEISVDIGHAKPASTSNVPLVPDAEPLTPRMRIVFANAEQAMRDKDFLLAIRLFSEVCQASPLVLKYREKLRRAERRAAGRRPKARRYRYRGRILYFQLRARWALQRGETLDAIRIAERGLRFDPWNKGLLMSQALAFEHHRRIDLCMWTLKQARERNPHDPSFNRPLAKLMQHIGAYDRSVHYWRQVKRELPEDRDIDDQIRMAMVQKTLQAGGYSNYRDDDDAPFDDESMDAE